MTKSDSLFLRFVSVPLLMAAWYFPVKDLSNTKPKEVQVVKVANINCMDGSKWGKAEFVAYPNYYDIYRDSKWIARVPSNLCALMSVE